MGGQLFMNVTVSGLQIRFVFTFL